MYDLCFTNYVQEAQIWNALTCAEFLERDASMIRNCFTWRLGDREFEHTAATDLLEAGLAQCFAVQLSVLTTPPRNFNYGICLPIGCQARDIAQRSKEFFDYPKLLFDPTVASEGAAVEVTVVELLPWTSLRDSIDFVVPGFVNSGSSTLARTLISHPEVSMVGGVELDLPQATRFADLGSQTATGDWRDWLCADLVPKSWVDTMRAEGAKPGVRAVGFKNPLMVYSEGCIGRLARAMPKLVLAVRDPLEWMLSTFKHNSSIMGHGYHAWEPPSWQTQRSTWFGRDHGLFGSLLTSLLRTWPTHRVLAIELEHLRHAGTAAIALDALCRFLGVTPFSELPVEDGAAEDSSRPGGLVYSRGLGASSRSWTHASLCAPTQAAAFIRMAESLDEEYPQLQQMLARVGVRELGVSSTVVRGGVYSQHCSEELSLPLGGGGPGAAASGSNGSEQAVLAAKPLGWLEQLLIEKRMRVDWRGEIGYKFAVHTETHVLALACGAGAGPLRHGTHVTLWNADSGTLMWVSEVGPLSTIQDNYAFGPAFPRPIALRPGSSYVLSVQAAPGAGLVPAGHVDVGVSAQMGTFVSGVYSRGPWLFPSEIDRQPWDQAGSLEQAYVNLVSMQTGSPL